ncbi:hypothetical protein BV898_18786, partial [Hypsibius exemplaris]
SDIPDIPHGLLNSPSIYNFLTAYLRNHLYPVEAEDRKLLFHQQAQIQDQEASSIVDQNREALWIRGSHDMLASLVAHSTCVVDVSPHSGLDDVTHCRDWMTSPTARSG